jgi:hypothetical protein
MAAVGQNGNAENISIVPFSALGLRNLTASLFSTKCRQQLQFVVSKFPAVIVGVRSL